MWCFACATAVEWAVALSWRSWSAHSVTVNATNDHTVQKLSQRRLTADWLAPRASDCSRTHNKVSSVWLPRYITATRPILEIFRIAWNSPDSRRTVKCSNEWYWNWSKERTSVRHTILCRGHATSYTTKVSNPESINKFYSPTKRQ